MTNATDSSEPSEQSQKLSFTELLGMLVAFASLPLLPPFGSGSPSLPPAYTQFAPLTHDRQTVVVDGVTTRSQCRLVRNETRLSIC
jgi:hypothetical protein